MFKEEIIDCFMERGAKNDIEIVSFGRCPICHRECFQTLHLFSYDKNCEFHCEKCVPTSFTPYHLSLDELMTILEGIIRKRRMD